MGFREFTNAFNQTKTPYPPIEWMAGLEITPEVKHVRKFGHNDDVGIAAYEDIWAYGGDVNFPNDTGQALWISSSDALDVHDIIIQGLDENFEEVNETITLQGHTFLPLTGLWSRVHRAYNNNSTVLAGTVYISSDNTDAGADGIPDVTTAVHSTIEPEFQQTMQGFYTVPADHVFMLTQMRATVAPVSGGTTKIATAQFMFRQYGGVWRVLASAHLQTNGTSSIIQTLSVPEKMPARSDIKIRAKGIGASVHMDAEFTGVLISL